MTRDRLSMNPADAERGTQTRYNFRRGYGVSVTAGVAAGVLATSAVLGPGIHITIELPSQPDHTTSNDTVDNQALDPSQPISLHTVRVHAQGETAAVNATDEVIKTLIQNTSAVYQADFEGNVPEFQVGDITDITAAANGLNYNNEPCYTTESLGAIGREANADTDKNTVAYVITDETPLCDADAAGQAYREERVIVMPHPHSGQIGDQEDPQQRDRRLSSIMAHEMGHILGIGHEGAIHCPDESEYALGSLLPRSTDMGELLGSNCDIKRDNSGEPDEYASTNTIMGNGTIRNEPLPFSSFNTIDRHLAFPDIYRIDEVASATNVTDYKIEIGEHTRNGVAILLPEKHALKAIDPSIDRIVATGQARMWNPPNNGTMEAKFEPSLYATNADYSLRISLPSNAYYDDVDTLQSYPLYLDESADLGITRLRDDDNNLIYRLTDYTTAQNLADANAAFLECYDGATSTNYRASLNELGSSCQTIHPDASTLFTRY